MSPSKLIISVTILISLTPLPVISIAMDCFEKSTVVAESEDIYIDHKIPALSKKDYSNIRKVMQAAVGEWKGDRSVKECFGARTSVTEKIEKYEVTGIAEFDGQEFTFGMELYSPVSKTRKTIDLNYFLAEDSFSLNSSTSGNAEVLDSTKAGFRYYKRFRQPKVGQKGTYVNENYYIFEVVENNAALKEYQYFNGELVLESITVLNKD